MRKINRDGTANVARAFAEWAKKSGQDATGDATSISSPLLVHISTDWVYGKGHLAI